MLASRQAMCLAWGPELTLIYNDAYAPVLGLKHPAAIGRPIQQVWSDVWADIEPMIRHALSGQAVWFEELHLVMERNGYPEDTWWQVSYSPARDDEGRIVGMLNVATEMTGKVQIEAALRASEARLRFLSELDEALRSSRDAPAAMLAAAELLALRLGATRCAYADVDPDNDRFVIRNDFSAPGVATSAGTYRLDLFGSRASADMRHGRTLVVADVSEELAPEDGRDMFQSIGINAVVCCPLIKQGRLAAMMAVHQDRPRQWQDDEVALVEAVVERCWAHIERAGSEARLRESEERLRLSVEHAEIGFWDVDLVRNELIWPPRTKALFGISPDVPVTMADFYGGLHPDDRDITSEAFAASADPARRAVYDVEYRTIGKEDGVVRWVAAKGRGVFDDTRDEARCIRVAGTAVDISARKRAEEELRALNTQLEQRVTERTLELRRFRDIVDATRSPICAFDADYRLIAFNRMHNAEFRRVNGFDTKLGDVLPDLFIPEQREVMRALMTRALSGESFTVVEQFGRPEYGTPFWEITYTPLLDEDGRVIGAFHLALDISDRLRAEAELETAQEALRQSQKMEAMGQLTGGVAHDFNNLLTPIVGSLDLLQRRGVGGEREQRLIAGAIQSAERAKTLVQRLLAFARRQPLQPVPVDVAALVNGMADLLSSTTGPQVRVVVNIAEDLPPAKADPNQLEMALLNLGVNARDAMLDGGTLRITATRESMRQSRGDLRRGQYVRLSVADTGVGMDEATLARAVEPFFSTKGIGKGTGLGLSMAHGLVAQLGGALTIESQLGVGTNVELWLPVSPNIVTATEALAAPLASLVERGLALLVDDEEVVRASTADMLEELGYRVQEASSAEAALALVAEGARPDLLVTDHLMPGMTGVDLARVLKERLPDLPVLIVSGYADAEGIAPDLPRLTKPFRSAELAASVMGLTIYAGASKTHGFTPT
ncbi:PAS domain-containing protein [Methylopila sp. Yamaguchi]|uniref:PAS domain-containing protein n=1 Tax=Methylopila sp. Yamaguchi TaxID=1437817 RepID=UPI00190EE535|nr:PAS domain-containing protein [Methylopila sp. Yamaguchi]